MLATTREATRPSRAAPALFSSAVRRRLLLREDMPLGQDTFKRMPVHVLPKSPKMNMPAADSLATREATGGHVDGARAQQQINTPK